MGLANKNPLTHPVLLRLKGIYGTASRSNIRGGNHQGKEGFSPRQSCNSLEVGGGGQVPKAIQAGSEYNGVRLRSSRGVSGAAGGGSISMTAAHTTNEKAAGASNTNGLHTDTNDLNFPTAERQGKAFATLAASFALAGHTLHRTNPNDGPVSYCAERWGQTRYLPNLDAALRFLMQIGGTP